MTRAKHKYGKWCRLAESMEVGGIPARLYELSDVTSLCNALRRRGERASYVRDRHGFKVVKLDSPGKEWKTVVFGAECDEDGNCPVCKIDFADCDCPGPTQEDEYEYMEVAGTLFAKRIAA